MIYGKPDATDRSKSPKNNPDIPIGMKIKEYRIAKKLTQNELVGDFITRNMLSKIENGSALPSIKTLEYIADKLEIPMSELVSDRNTDRLPPINSKSSFVADPGRDLPYGSVTEGDFVAKLSGQYELFGTAELLATELMEEGKLEEALPYVDLICSEKYFTDKKRNAYNYWKGIQQILAKKTDSAIEYFTKALEDSPSVDISIRIYTALERCYAGKGDYKNAYICSKKALSAEEAASQ